MGNNYNIKMIECDKQAQVIFTSYNEIAEAVLSGIQVMLNLPISPEDIPEADGESTTVPFVPLGGLSVGLDDGNLYYYAGFMEMASGDFMVFSSTDPDGDVMNYVPNV